MRCLYVLKVTRQSLSFYYSGGIYRNMARITADIERAAFFLSLEVAEQKSRITPPVNESPWEIYKYNSEGYDKENKLDLELDLTTAVVSRGSWELCKECNGAGSTWVESGEEHGA